ncbi:MAG: thioredoxin family protein [Actinomycetota bacterium]
MGKVIVLDDENFETEVLRSDLPMLVDLFALWCPSCHQLKPELDSIAEEEGDRLRVGTLNTDRFSLLTQEYFHFDLLPACILFVGGKQVARLDGYHPRHEILWEIEPFLARRTSDLQPPMTSLTSEY